MATRIHTRGEDIRKFILENVADHPADVSRLTVDRFGLTRQAVNKHLKKLVEEKALVRSGNTRQRTYRLCALLKWQQIYPIEPSLAEDVVWTNDIRPALGQLPDSVLEIWHYGFTEMFNNAIDHSGGTYIHVVLEKTAAYSEIAIYDDGVGIFRKIQAALGLLDERHALLELSKGKLTTDPKRHTGEGIFFSSRMFDKFDILSGGVFFTHEYECPEDWILERDKDDDGTAVWMKLNNHTARTTKKVFDQFSVGDDYGFNTTIVPVKLARYGNDQLISRSQAKRLLARVELFKVVIFNFEEVPTIGKAFADEIFRVFAQKHPEIQIGTSSANQEVQRVIEATLAHKGAAD